MPKKCAVGGSNGIKDAMDKVEPTDRELVAAVRNGGSPGRIGDLFVRHLGRVRNLMYQMTLNHADADDLTQEVFLRAARGLPEFDGRAEFATWLHRIALNCANSFLVRRARRADGASMAASASSSASCGVAAWLRPSSSCSAALIRSRPFSRPSDRPSTGPLANPGYS